MIAAKENIEKDEDYLELQNEYQFGLLREKIDLEQISSKVKITDEDMAVYYDKNKEKFKIIETETVKYKPLEEVKSEISNALRQQKFSETEKTYVESLRQKYPVKIFDDALAKAFKDM
jgi:anti-sigma-K factor RskA